MAGTDKVAREGRYGLGACTCSASWRKRVQSISSPRAIGNSSEVEGLDLLRHAAEEHAAWLEVLDIRS